ncbi:MAG: Shikimate kinase [Candidatus Gottesmanbacteria bacterium GW2011_GWA2_44_17]|uniref:Shikimate kinase n=1 Tax=Candidatus Gottesmanbacteria bacterium GW2011_GWA2_44_17 TaxID=1618444 RepID=A0A0G1JVR0_9BACT|nr:MAG: Shikimate kinase [Candidatus Gottesmanbacteria bacterium GW2011_GWA2_44_17]
MDNIILIGMKACGKSTVGKLLAKKLGIKFIELDKEIEKIHLINKKEKLNFREIFKKHGAIYFRQLESKILKNISREKKEKKFVLSCGGGTPLNENSQEILKKLGKVIFLDVDKIVLLPRILKHGVPAFFPYSNDPKKSLDELLEKRKPVYEKTADKTIFFDDETPEELVKKIVS